MRSLNPGLESQNLRSLNPGLESQNLKDSKPLVPNLDEDISEINKEYLCLKKKFKSNTRLKCTEKRKLCFYLKHLFNRRVFEALRGKLLGE